MIHTLKKLRRGLEFLEDNATDSYDINYIGAMLKDVQGLIDQADSAEPVHQFQPESIDGGWIDCNERDLRIYQNDVHWPTRTLYTQPAAKVPEETEAMVDAAVKVFEDAGAAVDLGWLGEACRAYVAAASATPQQSGQWMEVLPYTAPGEIKVGDLLLISDHKTTYSARCQMICRESEDPEIVFNRKWNHYFITSMYLNGQSWAKDVRIVRFKRTNPPKQEGK